MGIFRRQHSPIGIVRDGDIVRLAQTCAHGKTVIAIASAEIQKCGGLAEAICQARRSQPFRGRDAVLCIRAGDLQLLNVRAPLGDASDTTEAVLENIRGRLDCPDEFVSHFTEAGVVTQAQVRRGEYVALSCHKQRIADALAEAERAQLNTVAIDVEPGVIQRSFCRGRRRTADRKHSHAILHLDAAGACLVLIENQRLMLAKHVAVGSDELNRAVADAMQLSRDEATRVRSRVAMGRTSEDLRQAVAEATRPQLERLARELTMCTRYYTVTFRCQPPRELLLMGAEATTPIADFFAQRTGLECNLSNPLALLSGVVVTQRASQWELPLALTVRGKELESSPALAPAMEVSA
ncbi:MAG: pilus assembly protein PilM [Planctomycetales bacterium]|nr:pilus assembly protein PilM [Planctomycetales bacterium]